DMAHLGMDPHPRTDMVVEEITGPVRRLLRLARRVVEEIGRDDLSGVAAQMTYYIMLGLFPTLILLVGLLDALPLEREVVPQLERQLRGLPEDVASILSRYLRDFAGTRPSSGLLLWTLAAWWAASRGIMGARKGLDKVFRSRTRRHLALQKLQDLGLTLASLVLIGGGYLLLLGGKQLAHLAARSLDLGAGIEMTWVWLRLPITLTMLVIFVMLAYRFLPSRRVPKRALLAGALPTVIAWMLLGSAFRLWLKHLGNFDQIYGGLTSFFLLMVFIWLVALVLLLGGEICARLADRLEEGEGPPRDEKGATDAAPGQP
ncbi:MAG: YihY/virulence factor BrkB family protein, partial [Planctomycetota bacterium]